MSTALCGPNFTEFEQLGQTAGLAAGLARALADLSEADLAPAAPGRFAAVPVERVGEAATVAHNLAAAERVAILDLRATDTAKTPDHAITVGLRLAAVRIGLTRWLLDEAVAHLSTRTGGGEPLIRKQLNQGTVADVLAGLELLRRYLETTALSPTIESVVDIHQQLAELGWEVTRLFGASGYLADHPVRALYVAGLVANTWVSKGELP
ncbi:acyl-CoA dehydrogenase family protein [Actinophytocola sediminis]